MKVYIYGLYADEGPGSDANIRYVGKTVNPPARLKQHLADKTPCYKVNWIKRCKAQGKEVKLAILHEMDDPTDE